MHCGLRGASHLYGHKSAPVETRRELNLVAMTAESGDGFMMNKRRQKEKGRTTIMRQEETSSVY